MVAAASRSSRAVTSRYRAGGGTLLLVAPVAEGELLSWWVWWCTVPDIGRGVGTGDPLEMMEGMIPEVPAEENPPPVAVAVLAAVTVSLPRLRTPTAAPLSLLVMFEGVC